MDGEVLDPSGEASNSDDISEQNTSKPNNQSGTPSEASQLEDAGEELQSQRGSLRYIDPYDTPNQTKPVWSTTYTGPFKETSWFECGTL